MARKFTATMLLVPALVAAAPALANVGIASAVTGEPVGKPVATDERVLHIGNDVGANEIVTTQAGDRVQLVFLDGSSLTVGPDSQVAIDRFVYDAERRTGTQVFSAGRGVLRYVGGTISKTSEVTVRTAGATMGIRGGIAVFTVSSNGTATAALLFGASLSVTSNGVTVTTTQPGTQIVAGANAAPAAPVPLQPASLQQFDRAFQGAPQASAAPAIGAAVAGSSLGTANSGIAPSTARAAIPATRQAQLATGGPSPGQGPQAGAGPMQASSPLQGAEGSSAPGPGAGGQQMASVLQAAGPLDASQPFQASSPLQNSGPLATAGPTQQTGPVQTAMALAGPNTFIAPNMPTVPTPAQLGAALARGDQGALGQLESLLGGPQGSNPTTLASVVTGLSNPGNSGDAPGRGTGGNPGGGPPPSVPVVLPPQVFNGGSQASVSPN